MPKWVWVRDESTGHQYDVEASTLPRPGLTPVDGVDPVEGPGAQPRPAKPHVGKDGKFAAPKQPPAVDETEQDGTTESQQTITDKPADTAKSRSTR